jgi:hypothetical protein
MNKKRRRYISVCIAAALVMFGLGLPSPTRAEVLTNVNIPIAILTLIPCVPVASSRTECAICRISYGMWRMITSLDFYPHA